MIDYLFKKDCHMMQNSITPENPLLREDTESSYLCVIEELMSLPNSEPKHLPFFVSWREDKYEESEEVSQKFVDVCLINLQYIEPPKNLEPWGCVGDEEAPEGHYNLNEEKYNKYFGYGLTPWNELIDTEIINEIEELKDYEILAEILCELTFYGWTQQKQEEFSDMLEERMDQVKEEIKDGKCTVLKRENENQFDVVIPDCVKKDIEKGLNKIRFAEGAD